MLTWEKPLPKECQETGPTIIKNTVINYITNNTNYNTSNLIPTYNTIYTKNITYYYLYIFQHKILTIPIIQLIYIYIILSTDEYIFFAGYNVTVFVYDGSDFAKTIKINILQYFKSFQERKWAEHYW